MNSKFKSLIGDTLIFALGSLGSKCLLFLLVPLYTNCLSTSEYGTSDLVFTIAQLLTPFITVVIFDGIVRFGLSKDERPEDVLLVGLTVTGIGSVVLLLSCPLIKLYNPIKGLEIYLCLYVIFNSFQSTLNNYLKVKNKNKLYALNSILTTAVLAILNVLLLAVFKIGVKGYLLAYVIANFFSLSFAACGGNIFKDLKSAHIKKPLFAEMIKFCAPLILNNVSWWVIHSSDKVMLEAMIGTAALGIYTVSAKIPALINVMITVFQQAWGLSAVKEIESSNDKTFYSAVFKAYSCFSCVVCILLVAIIKPFMSVYVGKTFYDAWQYVPLLLASAVFCAISTYFGSMYTALKKSVNNMLTTLLAAVVNLIGNFIFIPLVGIWGAVIGTLMSYVVVALARMIDVRRYLDIAVNVPVFCANYLLVTIQAVLVSIDWNAWIASTVTAIIFVLINYTEIKQFFIMIKRIVKKQEG